LRDLITVDDADELATEQVNGQITENSHMVP
jgi:hypothetical protein